MRIDTELAEFRHSYYRLFVQLWWREPAVDFIAALGNDISRRRDAAAAVHPLLGEGWRTVAHFLAEQSPESVADEYTSLFVGPMAPQVNLYESYYLTGKFFGAPLANLRSFLGRVGAKKFDAQSAEPEDFLAFELEVMRWLIGKQLAQTRAQEPWMQRQTDFLREHLLIWVPACAGDIERCESARFYRGAAMLLRGFLELERELIREWGIEKLPSLEEIRRSYGAQPEWKGATFDAPDASVARVKDD